MTAHCLTYQDANKIGEAFLSAKTEHKKLYGAFKKVMDVHILCPQMLEKRLTI